MNQNMNDTDPDSGLDLSIKEIYAIIYYPESDPGQEYDIRNAKELADWLEVKKGDMVRVKYGCAKMQGTVVTVSDNYDNLLKNYESIIEEHREEIRRLKESTPNFSLKRRILRWLEQEKNSATNTPKYKIRKVLHTPDINPHQEEVQRAMDDVVAAYDRFHQLLANCEKGVEDLKSLKLDEMTTRLRNASVSSSSESSTDAEVLKRVLRQRQNNIEFDNPNETVKIGPKGTEVSKRIYESINWNSYSQATRKLLVTLFTRQTLATHSLTGKKSPAFLLSDKEAKAQLDPDKVLDIVSIVSKKCKVGETLVRSIITTKCSDENKMWLKRCQRSKENTENLPIKKEKKM